MKYLFMVSSIKFSKFNQFSFVPYILLLYVSLLSIPIFAQVEADITRPSINAEQFGISLKAETALNKGQLSLSIPLMELKGKGYNLPISLTFYNGDVTSCTEASPIGLGWSLMAGGVITTTIRGIDDIANIGSGEIIHHRDSNFIQSRFNNWQTNGFDFISDIQQDPMPDEYSYSLPGHSGTIEVSYENNSINRSLFPDESFKIEPDSGGYCITGDDGTKYIFRTPEYRVSGNWPETTTSTSWFLTKIKTIKGGEFTFHYSVEEYIDLSSTRDRDALDYAIYHTQRIDSICSEFGSVTFNAVSRSDRGQIGYRPITQGLESKRINRIVLKDENGCFVKGYELNNDSVFKLHEGINEAPDNSWYNLRLKLSSITQYDATGNHLPPYRFTYDYRFSKSRIVGHIIDTDPEGNYLPYDSWTSQAGTQVYVDLYGSMPFCSIGNQPNAVPGGWTESSGNYDSTAEDYFCLDRIDYPTGAVDRFIYAQHEYRKINYTQNLPTTAKIQGKCLIAKIRNGQEYNLRTEYIYNLHDADYNITNLSSGVLTNPSIHNATYYTPDYVIGYGWIYRASRISSGRAFNSFMGPPVCYTEVEEVEIEEKNEENDTINRTIHYFEPQIVSPPVNYILVKSYSPKLTRIENAIYGIKTGYSNGMESCNYLPFTYLAYPVGEFFNIATIVDKPLKEVSLGKDRKVRSIKDYFYIWDNHDSNKKYGYKIFNSEDSDYVLISRSEYITRKTRLSATTTTTYYYHGNECDSICEETQTTYNKGRIFKTDYTRGYGANKEERTTRYYFPDNISNIMESGSSSEIVAVKGLIEKNIVADPIKTVVKRKDIIVSGECRDYQMRSNKPLLKSLYKVKNTGNNSINTPIVNNNTINYFADLYKDGEIMKYDSYYNPEYVKLNETQNRIYVWGYSGRFPIAVIDNMDSTAYQSLVNLRTKILELETYKKIDTESECTRLRNTNAAIRSNLPDSAHITTYTYDPYFGMTSEIDDSNLGKIYTYDSFGRLFAIFDVNYRKKEEYNYHYKQQ